MCLMIVLNQVRRDFPVIVAANRDERYDRPATGPQVLAPRIVGGRDLVAGGTWLGATAGGFFAGLTNQRTWRAPDPARRSRGEVVLALLAAGGREAAEAWLRAVDPADYNAFNAIFGDADGLSVAYVRHDRLRVEPVPPGVHVLPNDVLDSADFPKAGRVAARALEVLDRPWEALVPALREILADHAVPDPVPPPPPESDYPYELVRRLSAVCIHTEAYGTRSSALVALAPGEAPRYLAADGPPCTTDFRDVSGLFTN
jgi:uncharacterized protein with NRDE domain